MDPRFRLALDLAYTTGHRIGAILRLQWEDIDYREREGAPFGTIRWRAQHDKVGNEHVTPMSRAVAARLRSVQREVASIGEAWLFPSEGDPTVPVDRRLTSRWLRKAEQRAGLPHVRGGGWHAFRRGWATARKEFPLKDVAHAGGWRDTESLLRCYTHADPDTVYRVVSAVPWDEKLGKKLSHPM